MTVLAIILIAIMGISLLVIAYVLGQIDARTALGYRKKAEGEHICCKDCKFSECCVVQIRAYNEEIDAELLSSDPNDFYCAFAKMKGGE